MGYSLSVQNAQTPELLRKQGRPTGVTVLAIAYLVGGIAFLILGGLWAVPQAASEFHNIFPFVGPSALIFGILTVLSSYGLWSGVVWGWTFCTAVTAIGTAFSTIFSGILVILNFSRLGPPSYITALFVLQLLIPTLFGLMVMWYLWRPRVKAYFVKSSRP